ncbi:MAG: DUF6279 family lipoprotein [Wenzhouxiangella sp.]
MNRIIRTIGLVLLLALLAGCTTRLAYNNLDWLAVRWVEREVELDRDQRAQLRDQINEQQLWHCATQLADYQAWTEQLWLDLLSDRLDRQRLIEHGEQLAEFGRTLAERIAPLLVELATSLDDDQVAAIMLALDERIDQLQDEIESRSDQQWVIDRTEGMERRLRRLMGPTNPAQRARLERWARALEPTHQHQLNQRLYWRERIAEALARRDEREFLQDEINALLDPAAAWPEGYRQAIEANRELTLDALADLVRLTEPDQRGRISARLARLKNDFERLSCEGEAPPALLAAAGSD